MSLAKADFVCVGEIPQCSNPDHTFKVPDGMVLVIETIAANGKVTNGATGLSATLALDMPNSNSGYVFTLGRLDYANSAYRLWEKTFAATIRAGAGTTVRGWYAMELRFERYSFRKHDTIRQARSNSAVVVSR